MHTGVLASLMPTILCNVPVVSLASHRCPTLFVCTYYYFTYLLHLCHIIIIYIYIMYRLLYTGRYVYYMYQYIYICVCNVIIRANRQSHRLMATHRRQLSQTMYNEQWYIFILYTTYHSRLPSLGIMFCGITYTSYTVAVGVVQYLSKSIQTLFFFLSRYILLTYQYVLLLGIDKQAPTILLNIYSF